MAKKYQIIVDQHEDEGCTELEFNSTKLADDLKVRLNGNYSFSTIVHSKKQVIFIVEPVISKETIENLVSLYYNSETIEVL